jgi:class 3 adenylate cyclase
MAQTRRLAAIVAADVVGYSRLMGEDEAGTAKAMREHREAATPIVLEFGGRLVKTTGDGVLLEFPSVVAVVECAIAIQKQMAERNADVPEGKRILYRMGVNVGDVLLDGEDILGDGVNIAARLESIAEPGGICISGSAYDQVRGRIEADFRSARSAEICSRKITGPFRGSPLPFIWMVERQPMGQTRERRQPDGGWRQHCAIFLAQRERIYAGMRKGEVPEE